MHEIMWGLKSTFPKVDSMAIHVLNILETTIFRFFVRPSDVAALFQLKNILLLLALYVVGYPIT